jgi:hypothetical protein
MKESQTHRAGSHFQNFELLNILLGMEKHALKVLKILRKDFLKE